jgi:hypothetical protein
MPTNWAIVAATPSAPVPKGETGDVPATVSIVAWPLGGRIKVDPFNGQLHFLKSKSVGLVSEYEKMPFEVTPVFLYLTRQNNETAAQKLAD